MRGPDKIPRHRRTKSEIKSADLAARLKPMRPRRESRPRSERRAENREKLIPADRLCPVCGKVKLKSRQWVFAAGFQGCVSCFRTLHKEITE